MPMMLGMVELLNDFAFNRTYRHIAETVKERPGSWAP